MRRGHRLHALLEGLQHTVWLKAKPEWAKGPRLARITPRFNPEVNGYWMCDIGRFDYHWIEADDAAAAGRSCARVAGWPRQPGRAALARLA